MKISEILPMNSVLLDTNILIYALDRSSAFHEKSVHIIENPGFELYITSKVVSEYFAVCSRLELDNSVVLNFYRELRNNSSLIFPNDASIEVFETMLQKYRPKGTRVYDVEIASIAYSYNIDFLASFNVGDFGKIDEIKLLNIPDA